VQFRWRVVIERAATAMPPAQMDVVGAIRRELDWLGPGRLDGDRYYRLVVSAASMEEALRVKDQVDALVSERGWWIMVTPQERDSGTGAWLDVPLDEEPAVEENDAALTGDSLSDHAKLYGGRTPSWALATAQVIAELPTEDGAKTFALHLHDLGIPAILTKRRVSIPAPSSEHAWLLRGDLESAHASKTKLRVRGVSTSRQRQH
jgi:hypothetical protein